MAATQEDVQDWIDTAKLHNKRTKSKRERITHIISVCDRFNYEDYPVYVKVKDDLEEKKAYFDGKRMQTINEVIEIV